MKQNYVTATLSIMETATLLRASSAGWFGCSTTTTSFEGSYTYYATEEIDIDVCNRTTSGYTQHGERRFFGFNGQTQTYVVRCCAALAITLLAPQRATYVWTSTYSRKWHADGMKFLLFDLWRTCKFLQKFDVAANVICRDRKFFFCTFLRGLRIQLVSGWGLRKLKSVAPYGTVNLGNSSELFICQHDSSGGDCCV